MNENYSKMKEQLTKLEHEIDELEAKGIDIEQEHPEKLALLQSLVMKIGEMATTRINEIRQELESLEKNGEVSSNRSAEIRQMLQDDTLPEEERAALQAEMTQIVETIKRRDELTQEKKGLEADLTSNNYSADILNSNSAFEAQLEDAKEKVAKEIISVSEAIAIMKTTALGIDISEDLFGKYESTLREELKTALEDARKSRKQAHTDARTAAKGVDYIGKVSDLVKSGIDRAREVIGKIRDSFGKDGNARKTINAVIGEVAAAPKNITENVQSAGRRVQNAVRDGRNAVVETAGNVRDSVVEKVTETKDALMDFDNSPILKGAKKARTAIVEGAESAKDALLDFDNSPILNGLEAVGGTAVKGAKAVGKAFRTIRGFVGRVGKGIRGESTVEGPQKFVGSKEDIAIQIGRGIRMAGKVATAPVWGPVAGATMVARGAVALEQGAVEFGRKTISSVSNGIKNARETHYTRQIEKYEKQQSALQEKLAKLKGEEPKVKGDEAADRG